MEHVVHILGKAEARVGGGAIVEVSSEAEEAWSFEILKRAGWFATVMGCTPGYITSEGEALRQSEDQLEMMRKARAGPWSHGMESFMGVLKEYRDEGSLQGFQVVKATA